MWIKMWLDFDLTDPLWNNFFRQTASEKWLFAFVFAWIFSNNVMLPCMSSLNWSMLRAMISRSMSLRWVLVLSVYMCDGVTISNAKCKLDKAWINQVNVNLWLPACWNNYKAHQILYPCSGRKIYCVMLVEFKTIYFLVVWNEQTHWKLSNQRLQGHFLMHGSNFPDHNTEM